MNTALLMIIVVTSTLVGVETGRGQPLDTAATINHRNFVQLLCIIIEAGAVFLSIYQYGW